MASIGRNTYLIPRRMLKKSTIFDGIGGREVILLGISAVIGIILYSIGSSSGLNIIINIIMFLLPILIMYFFVAPRQYNESLLVITKRYMEFRRSRLLYFYKRVRKKNRFERTYQIED
jgi:hypothetical protein